MAARRTRRERLQPAHQWLTVFLLPALVPLVGWLGIQLLDLRTSVAVMQREIVIQIGALQARNVEMMRLIERLEDRIQQQSAPQSKTEHGG